MDKEMIFDALELSDEERKHIEIRDNGVGFRFVLKNTMGLEAGAPHEIDALARIHRSISEFWDKEADRGRVTFKARLADACEAEFFKEAATENEVKDAVLSFVKLRRKLGI